MAMELEYPMNIIILTVVVLVIIGIMFGFRDRIMKFCIFPPCNEEIICDVKPIVTTENDINQAMIENYCTMCLAKNRNGECKEDALCYIVNIPMTNPNSINPSNCKITCDKDVTSFFVNYKFLDKNITITC